MTGETWKLTSGHKLGVRKFSHFIFWTLLLFMSPFIYVDFLKIENEVK
jgi:hypothetical protein